MSEQLSNSYNRMNRQRILMHLCLLCGILSISLHAGAVDGLKLGYTTATGTDGTTVSIDDLKDHTWTYYSGVDASVDSGNYNTNYKNIIYSPNPRNVTINYDGNGGAVSMNEEETKFIYYVTLEESETEGEYAYQVISNPFSKQPTIFDGDGIKVYQGFAGWKITSGHKYIKRADGTMATENAVLNLDEEITFVNLPYEETNCMSATIGLQATWTKSVVQYVTSNGNQVISFSGGDYETNFVVIKTNYSGNLTISSPCTIMMVEPDGSADYRDDYSFTGTIKPNNSGVTKVEWMKWNSDDGTLNAYGKNLTIGRGIKGGCSTITGFNGSMTIGSYTLKIESGTYSNIYFHANSGSVKGSNMEANVVLGNDYDRAKKDNEQLIITKKAITSENCTYSNSNNLNTHSLNLTIKSGKILPAYFIETNPSQLAESLSSGQKCLYLGSTANSYIGRRNVLIQGGELPTIAGGASGDLSRTSFFPKVKIKMIGGTVHGCIYGGASYLTTTADVVFVSTAGKVIGSVAGGCYGSRKNIIRGKTEGASYIYIGGQTSVQGDQNVNAGFICGYVYGAGFGRSDSPNSGEMTLGTNVVIADNAYVEHGVLGWGNYGSSNSDNKIYITGGTINGSLYGGYNTSGSTSGNFSLYMTGGKVNGSVFGGSNKTELQRVMST